MKGVKIYMKTFYNNNKDKWQIKNFKNILECVTIILVFVRWLVSVKIIVVLNWCHIYIITKPGEGNKSKYS